MQDTLNVSVEEKLAIFLLIVAHAVKMGLIHYWCGSSPWKLVYATLVTVVHYWCGSFICHCGKIFTVT
jgi:membrane protein YdbS with pleckstrin-like domain